MDQLNAEYKLQMIEDEINARMAKRRERIYKVMDDHHLTLEELGKLTGVAESSIQRYLTGETVKIPIDFFDKVSEVTGVDKRYLACFDDEKSAPIEGYQSEFEEIFNKLDKEKREELKRYATYLSEK